MSEYFVYGTLLPGSRHNGILTQLEARRVGPACLEPGYRLSVRYRGHGDDRFDRSNPNHYVEPILIRDRTSRDRVLGEVYQIDEDPTLVFGKIIGAPRSYPLVSVRLESGRTALATVRATDVHDLIYRTDPCLHRFEDGRVQFYDLSTYLVTQGRIVEIPTTTLYQADIDAGTDQRRISVEVLDPKTQTRVPAFEYVAR